MTRWTVVFRKSKYASTFTPTGLDLATWDEATEEARRIAQELPEGAHVYYVTTTETHIEHQGADGIVTAVKIAPTKEAKAAAKAREAAITAMVAKAKGDWISERVLGGWGGRVGATTLRDAAAAAVDRGMSWSAVCFTQS